MKSFHFLSVEQVAVLPFLDGGVVVLDDLVAGYFRDFFIAEKARSVTIGSMHPDPTQHEANFGGDYLYFTTDSICSDMNVMAEFPSSVNEGIRRDLLQVEVHGNAWLMEIISSPLNPRYSLAHLLPKPQNSINGLQGLEKQLVYENEMYNDPKPAAPQVTPPVDLTTKEERDQLLAKVNTFKQLYEESTRENTQLKNENAMLVSELEKHRLAQAGDAGHSAEMHEMMMQAKEAEVQAEQCRKDLRSLKSENESYKRKLQTVKKEMVDEHQRSSDKFGHIKRENERLANTVNEHADTTSTVKKLKKEIDTLRGRVSDHKAAMAASAVENDGKIDRLQRDRDRLTHEVTEMKEKLVEKEKQIQRKAKITKTEHQQQQMQIAQLQTQQNSQRSKSNQRSRSTQRATTPVRGRSAGRPGGATPAKEAKTEKVTDEVVVKEDYSDRIEVEMALHQARFKGKEAHLIECLQMLYGTDQEYEVLLAKKEAEDRAREEGTATLKNELHKCTQECVLANKAVAAMREKEQGMARKFLEADKEYSEELLAMRRQVLAARADASLMGTELTTLRKASILSPTLSSPHRSRSIPSHARPVVSPPPPFKG
eukprot:TRINITY_DN24163_c0_g1_i1.p1 TRINITY_DN24163_c0_g1~~TRINITY_DN24163_c0_g1_i1.p1  ORF type:complete len:617 (+),score=229.12 TRINITY_DN24163_c0_g1_i1:62-1852(+)